MASGWSNEETLKFIELYENHPEIWDPKHKYHKEKNKIIEAWVQIADEMKVPVTELKKKKESLLAGFRLNHKKVLASIESGEPEPFKPTWIFYDALASFMSNVYTCKSIFVKEEDETYIIEVADDKFNSPPSPTPHAKFLDLSNPVKKRRSNKLSKFVDNTSQVETVFTPNNMYLTKNDRTINDEEDDCDLYGRLVAKALREFDEIDRLELRHEIDGLIIKKKRSQIRHVELSTDRPSTSHSMYSEQSIEDRPTSALSGNSSV